MEKVLENVKKEIKQIGEQGINANNIDVLYKLIDIEKDIYKIKEKEGGKDSMMRGQYMDGGYGARGRGGRYSDGGYNDYSARGGGSSNYRGEYGARGNYRGGEDERIYQHLDRIMEGADEYQYGRSRYMDGGNQDRMEEGLEKLMYALCVFIESMCDFAETPEEKEIIRRHIQKMKGM